MSISTQLRRAFAVAVAAASLVSLAACGHVSSSASESTDNNADAKTVVVGENTKTNKPFNYINDDGQIDGYEAQLLREADKLLPQYKFEYRSLDWSNLLVSLDTGKIDVAASSLQLNDERAQKYGHTTVPNSNYIVNLVVPENSDIKSIDDLAGKTMYVWNGEATTKYLEDWNAAHPDKKINLKYGDWTFEQAEAALESGQSAAKTGAGWRIATENKEHPNFKLKAVGEPLQQDNSYFLLDKKDTELAKALDGAITKLRDNGTLKKLSEQYLNGDFTEPVKDKYSSVAD